MSERPSAGIGRRLARYRRIAGYSAQQLSDLIGGELSRGVIANIESGRKTDVTVDQLLSLSWALQVPFAALALPIDEPYRFVALGGEWSPRVRSSELLSWMLWRKDLLRVQPPLGNPAAFMGNATIEGLIEWQQLLERVRELRGDVQRNPRLTDALENAERDLADKERSLMGLEIDFTPFKIEESSDG